MTLLIDSHFIGWYSRNDRCAARQVCTAAYFILILLFIDSHFTGLLTRCKGSGKTTFCDGMQQYLRLLGRNAFIVNLDPANERRQSPALSRRDEARSNDESVNGSNPQLPYDTLFDAVQEAVKLSSVMEQTGLGPNGGLMYCMEYLEAHADDVVERVYNHILREIEDKNSTRQAPYLIFDFPGQVELYTHSTSVQTLMWKLSRRLDLRLSAVQLIDAQYCTDATKFLSAALLGTTTMIRLELPMVCVLSKVDVLYRHGDESELPMQLEFFTECHDLEKLLPFIDNPSRRDGDADDEFDIADDPEYQSALQKRRQTPFYRKFEKLHAVLAEVIEDYGLLSFIPLSITSAESVGRVLARVDKCNGYVFEGSESSIQQDMFQCAIQADSTFEALSEIQERLSARPMQR
jgi:GPN-loop GTPase